MKSAAPAFDPQGYVRAETQLLPPSLVPEIPLHRAVEGSPLWRFNDQQLRLKEGAPAFWSIAWPGGQGIARYLLDEPETAKGKRVLDMAAGSGIGAIAAMKAGASHALAIDIDPLAHVAMHLNAAENGVSIACADYLNMNKAPKGFDLIITGDICYDQAMAARLMRWLWLCVADGIRVIMADPGRAYVPASGLRQLAAYRVPTSRAIELDDARDVRVWDVGLPD